MKHSLTEAFQVSQPSLGQAPRDYNAVGMDCNPPLMATYQSLFISKNNHQEPLNTDQTMVAVEECELPLIDLSLLCGTNLEAEQCKRDITDAASGWGFFQVVNHGISTQLLQRVREEQVNVFRQPFEKKVKKLLDFSSDSYRWGTPTATDIEQLSWSEAYHIPLTPATEATKVSTRYIIEECSAAMSRLAHQLAGILTEGFGDEGGYIKEKCTYDTCYLRLNRYPPCPLPGAFGLIPHTDSDFLTILYQDQVGGLQLMKGNAWLTVKPNPNALIINIGDLFQAWSNGLYKSVEHRVMTNAKLERYSVAYFLCPSYDTVIQSFVEPGIYRKFSFGEYREKIKEDVRVMGRKIGLSRFLA
ncbi:gibberellin 2-beta-dioxygenase 8-like [Typha angustifolia]|uniref:gibberellin 2-beta-dioxygenase 8-like n=1 Tax=Typha angustifolia TaxID=59011 RepID=UPI003C2E30EC